MRKDCLHRDFKTRQNLRVCHLFYTVWLINIYTPCSSTYTSIARAHGSTLQYAATPLPDMPASSHADRTASCLAIGFPQADREFLRCMPHRQSLTVLYGQRRCQVVEKVQEMSHQCYGNPLMTYRRWRTHIEYACDDLIAVAIIGEFTLVFIRPLPLRRWPGRPYRVGFLLPDCGAPHLLAPCCPKTLRKLAEE